MGLNYILWPEFSELVTCWSLLHEVLQGKLLQLQMYSNVMGFFILNANRITFKNLFPWLTHGCFSFCPLQLHLCLEFPLFMPMPEHVGPFHPKIWMEQNSLVSLEASSLRTAYLSTYLRWMILSHPCWSTSIEELTGEKPAKTSDDSSTEWEMCSYPPWSSL